MSNTVEEINPQVDLSPMMRETNKGMMVRFINDNLLSGGAALDVRRSVVLYDEYKMFKHAMAELPNELVLKALREQAGVHYWSRGVI